MAELTLAAISNLLNHKLDEKLQPLQTSLAGIETRLGNVEARLEAVHTLALRTDKRSDEDLRPIIKDIEKHGKRIKGLETAVNQLKAKIVLHR